MSCRGVPRPLHCLPVAIVIQITPAHIRNPPVTVDPLKLALVISHLQPAPTKKRKLLQLAVGYRPPQFLERAINLPIDVVLQHLTATIHPKKLEPRTMSNENQLCRLSLVIPVPKMPTKARSLQHRSNLFKPLPVAIQNGEVRVHVIMQQNAAFSCPAKHHSGPHPVVTLQPDARERIVQLPQIIAEHPPQRRVYGRQPPSFPGEQKLHLPHSGMPIENTTHAIGATMLQYRPPFATPLSSVGPLARVTTSHCRELGLKWYHHRDAVEHPSSPLCDHTPCRSLRNVCTRPSEAERSPPRLSDPLPRVSDC